jgi:catechol 2,3-dioxygenase-like lactoylglutathione lyase family enzyme
MSHEQPTYWNPMVPELTVSDFATSLHFYVEILGFELMNQRKDPPFAYLSIGDAQLMIEQYHAEGWKTGALERPFGRGVNFQIEVDDIKPIVSSLKLNGIPLFRPLQDNYYVIGETTACQRECLVQDPDGYLLRFSQFIS